MFTILNKLYKYPRIIWLLYYIVKEYQVFIGGGQCCGNQSKQFL